jgi:carboxymethylenebutenolidase
MKGIDVRIAAADGLAIETYLVGDQLPPRPAIMMFPPIFGADTDARAIADRWAGRGYLVALPDYFFRTAPGVLDRSDAGRKAAMARWKSLDVERTIADMAAVKDYLLSCPSCSGRFAALGFCAGGELAFLAATRLGATAVATFHATHIDRHLNEAAEIAGTVTLHYGGNDNLVPLDRVDEIRKCLASNPHVDVKIYDGAGHGFSFPTQTSYHEVAATESDRRAEQVLGALLG